MKPPCSQDCPDRSPTCHSECEKYQEFQKKNAAERDRRYRENEVERYIGEKYDKAARKARGRRKR